MITDVKNNDGTDALDTHYKHKSLVGCSYSNIMIQLPLTTDTLLGYTTEGKWEKMDVLVYLVHPAMDKLINMKTLRDSKCNAW